MARIALTAREKDARGTRDRSKERTRALATILAEVAEVEESLDDMQFNLREAGKAIRREGVLIDVVARNSSGQEVRTKKLNPACKLQRDMLSAIKSARRALVILADEQERAQPKTVEIDPDFVGLD
jgi:hypothetical protein